MAREELCAIQSVINLERPLTGDKHSIYIQNLIDQLDMHRPLGPDGKHGDRHTPTCECEDKSVGVRTTYITGHETKQVETTVWKDDSVTYRNRTRDYRISGAYWGEWKDGWGE